MSDLEMQRLYLAWAQEELDEMKKALALQDKLGVIDAWGDLLGIALMASSLYFGKRGTWSTWYQVNQGSRGRQPFYPMKVMEELLVETSKRLDKGMRTTILDAFKAKRGLK